MIPNDLATAQQLEAEGYFEKARAGDHRACSLFARLVAYRLNPTGHPGGWGWLRKGGGQNVDGYSEDAIVYGSNPQDLQNVCDMVGGAGAPGASLTWQEKPRRPVDTWEAPRPLSAADMNYLKAGSAHPTPTPTPAPTPPPAPNPTIPDYEAIGGDATGAMVGRMVFEQYGEKGEDPNAGMGAWMFRAAYRIASGKPVKDTISAVRGELRKALGLPVLVLCVLLPSTAEAGFLKWPRDVRIGLLCSMAADAYDLSSTFYALGRSRGLVEANPLLKGVVKSPGALTAVKVAAAIPVNYAGLYFSSDDPKRPGQRRNKWIGRAILYGNCAAKTLIGLRNERLGREAGR